MNSLGIYFGPTTITIVESQSKIVRNVITIPQTLLGTFEAEDKAAADVKLNEVSAFFKSEINRNNITAQEAVLSLAGQDIFVRTFEMPMMEQNELVPAVKFEAEKYIPFKTEFLISDFQIRPEKQSHTNIILFIGIKKDILERYLVLLNQLNIRITAVDYSGFGILRCLPLTGVTTKGVMAVLSADVEGGDELNFCVLENGFPLFSRDITLAQPAAVPPAAAQPQANQGMSLLEKLKNEIRVSLDYYERKFPAKTIRKLVLLSKLENRPDIENFSAELGFSFQFIDLRKFIPAAFPYTLGVMKGYSASVAKIAGNNLKINLLQARERLRQTKEKAAQFQSGAAMGGLFEGMRVAPATILLGAAACGAAYGFGMYQTMPLRNEIESLISGQPKIALVNPQAPVQDLDARRLEYKKKLDVYEELLEKQVYLTEPLSLLPRIMPKGVWLTNLAFSKKNDGSDLSIDGTAYLGDSNKEFQAVYQLLAALNSTPEMKKYFKAINISSITRGQAYSLPVTNFMIMCKGSQEPG